jgi:hypothetical protein
MSVMSTLPGLCGGGAVGGLHNPYDERDAHIEAQFKGLSAMLASMIVHCHHVGGDLVAVRSENDRMAKFLVNRTPEYPFADTAFFAPPPIPQWVLDMKKSYSSSPSSASTGGAANFMEFPTASASMVKPDGSVDALELPGAPQSALCRDLATIGNSFGESSTQAPPLPPPIQHRAEHVSIAEPAVCDRGKFMRSIHATNPSRVEDEFDAVDWSMVF